MEDSELRMPLSVAVSGALDTSTGLDSSADSLDMQAALRNAQDALTQLQEEQRHRELARAAAQREKTPEGQAVTTSADTNVPIAEPILKLTPLESATSPQPEPPALPTVVSTPGTVECIPETAVFRITAYSDKPVETATVSFFRHVPAPVSADPPPIAPAPAAGPPEQLPIGASHAQVPAEEVPEVPVASLAVTLETAYVYRATPCSLVPATPVQGLAQSVAQHVEPVAASAASAPSASIGDSPEDVVVGASPTPPEATAVSDGPPASAGKAPAPPVPVQPPRPASAVPSSVSRKRTEIAINRTVTPTTPSPPKRRPVSAPPSRPFQVSPEPKEITPVPGVSARLLRPVKRSQLAPVDRGRKMKRDEQDSLVERLYVRELKLKQTKMEKLREQAGKRMALYHKVRMNAEQQESFVKKMYLDQRQHDAAIAKQLDEKYLQPMRKPAHKLTVEEMVEQNQRFFYKSRESYAQRLRELTAKYLAPTQKQCPRKTLQEEAVLVERLYAVTSPRS
eukprot:TRINITY_DN96712_c0_g1_i1.p1 TRINITY_DN96712_c0_g1~~TRINITY_DN96712_c0_g1_i1.p1  ORF type:complete len:510 (-),score=69.48 TRINITY_DN96712_c0_g1_i1:7-1536(-)